MQQQRGRAERMVPIALRGGRVTSTFRDAVFDAATRRGMSVNEYVLTATGERLKETGQCFTGVFHPGDIGQEVV